MQLWVWNKRETTRKSQFIISVMCFRKARTKRTIETQLWWSFLLLYNEQISKKIIYKRLPSHLEPILFRVRRFGMNSWELWFELEEVLSVELRRENWDSKRAICSVISCFRLAAFASSSCFLLATISTIISYLEFSTCPNVSISVMH